MRADEPDTPLTRQSFWRSYIVVDSEKPCPACGYSLAGLEFAAAKCPECGRELSAEDHRAEYRFRPVWESVRDVCVLPVIAASIMLLSSAVALLIDDGVAGVVMFIAGACWLLSGGVMALYLLAEGLRAREFRSRVQRTEHLARVGYAACGLIAAMIAPPVCAFALIQIAAEMR